MYEYKPISPEAAALALERAERYRLLNEPAAAESICRDILLVDPGNQRARIVLILALTDQFDERPNDALSDAGELLKGIADDYKRAYYHGIMCERKAKSHLRRGGHDDRHAAYDWFMQAMQSYEQAESMRPQGNDEAILRWNTCARVLNRHPEVVPPAGREVESMLE